MIKELFLKALEQDNPEQYLTDWDLQFHQETRDNQVFDFKDFKGKEDLVKWMNWCGENEQPCYMPLHIVEPFVKQSYDNDIAVNTRAELPCLPPVYSTYRKRIGLSNAIDYVIPRMFKSEIHNVLDVGAGYGRQANLWGDGVYVGIDAVLNSYCCQHEYYKSLDKTLAEYMGHIRPVSISEWHDGIYHLPTWRYDLLPDNFFDMVMCVQVLRELGTELVKKMLTEFHRVLKVGGIIYIRDHAEAWMPCTTLNIHEYLLNLGFEKGKTDDPNWKENIIDGKDLHGLPRIYVKK